MIKRAAAPKKNEVLSLSNHEIVVVAAYLAGADYRHTDTEDIAVKANEIAPGRFTWRKYKDQINIDTVRKRLWDAAKAEKGAYLIGSERQGWQLTPAGLTFAKEQEQHLDALSLSRERHTAKEQTWVFKERARMQAETAFQKYQAGNISQISAQEAEKFFRIDDYVLGDARREKINRAKVAFGEDAVLAPAIEALSELVRAKK